MTPRSRVLLVAGAYSPELSSGGLQSAAVARALRPHLDAQVLTTTADPGLSRQDEVDGVRVSRVYINVKSRLSRAGALLWMARALARLLPAVDLVHIQGYSSKNILLMALARLFGRPVILHLQTAKHDEPPAVKAQGRLAWWAFRSATLYLSVSPALTAAAVAAGLPRDKFRDVPNGVDPVRFSPAPPAERKALREKLGLAVEGPIVLFVGIFSRDKQPQVLFEAWLELQRNSGPASTLVCVGATSPRQFEADAQLAASIREAADRSGFGDRLQLVPPTSTIEDYFRAADVFVLPSAREGLPIVLLEAMACGLPCIASHLPGSTDVMIDTGLNGYLVPPGESSALARALRTVLERPAEAARLGAAARATIEARFTIARVAEQWLAAYHEVLATR
jgi:glycosyltransferase involved in cell wall biosynthesis